MTKTMKKLMNFWLLAALVCGLGLGVTSCKIGRAHV